MGLIRKIDLIRVLLRSFYIQSSWNPERLLALGFCFCLVPIARRLMNSKTERIDFLQRHLEFFNSHPYMATYALGAVANIEEQAIVKRWGDKRPIKILKDRIIGPLGAIGDTLFWQMIRPALGLLTISLLWIFGAWATVFYLVAYNFAHFYVQFKGLFDSYTKGFDVVRILSMRGLQKYLNLLKRLFAILLGIELVVLMKKVHLETGSWKSVLIFAVAALLSFVIVRRQKITIDLLVIIVICGSIIIGLVI